ncbi:hypothetical protein QR98_0034150 [Sarcoptes scabiei]|uniref:Uncharacterized protein n=1 Tax=Sarcoptes scabiei TaxID=52283 RepID=A0A132A2A0_SARSC|nr:hypothetical protein QR98_0034150 [Sarcoptes scabiei]
MEGFFFARNFPIKPIDRDLFEILSETLLLRFPIDFWSLDSSKSTIQTILVREQIVRVTHHRI